MGTKLFLYLKVVKIEYIKDRLTKVSRTFAVIRVVNTIVLVIDSLEPKPTAI